MKANIDTLFFEWEKTITKEESADGTCVRFSFVDGSFIEYYEDDPYGRPYVVRIGNGCNTFKTLKAATWNLWEEWARYNVEGES